jgi:hypothetical protein
MKKVSLMFMVGVLVAMGCAKKEQSTETAVNNADAEKTKNLYLDVHNLEPGKVTFDAVAGAHQKDLATQGKYDVSFIKYWVDEKAGKVYCLSEAPDSASVYKTHQEAHGLVPALVERVTDGMESALKTKGNLYFDVHHLGAGKVTAEAVAGAHVKDLAVQDKYGVNFVNYWVDPKLGIVMCLAEAPDSISMVNTHKEAHGLIPDEVHQVKQGN